MASKSYPDEFKIEAVRQVTDRGYKPKDVAERAYCKTYKAVAKNA